jgi:hypothetical protein
MADECQEKAAICRVTLKDVGDAKVVAVVADVVFRMCHYKRTGLAGNVPGIGVANVLYREPLSPEQKKGILLGLERCGAAADFADLLQTRESGYAGRAREFPIRSFIRESGIGWDFVWQHYQIDIHDRAQFLLGFAYGAVQDVVEILSFVIELVNAPWKSIVLHALERAPKVAQQMVDYIDAVIESPTLLVQAIQRVIAGAWDLLEKSFRETAKKYNEALYDLNFSQAGRHCGRLVAGLIELLGGVTALAKVGLLVGRKAFSASLSGLKQAWKQLHAAGVPWERIKELLRQPAPRLKALSDGTILFATEFGIGLARKVDGLIEWVGMRLPAAALPEELLVAAEGPPVRVRAYASQGLDELDVDRELREGLLPRERHLLSAAEVRRLRRKYEEGPDARVEPGVHYPAQFWAHIEQLEQAREKLEDFRPRPYRVGQMEEVWANEQVWRSTGLRFEIEIPSLNIRLDHIDLDGFIGDTKIRTFTKALSRGDLADFAERVEQITKYLDFARRAGLKGVKIEVDNARWARYVADYMTDPDFHAGRMVKRRPFGDPDLLHDIQEPVPSRDVRIRKVDPASLRPGGFYLELDDLARQGVVYLKDPLTDLSIQIVSAN